VTPERVRVTISLTKELADAIDEMVDGVRIRNRSHAIETLVTDNLELSQIHHAVILAGGEEAMRNLPEIRKTLQLLQRYGIFEVTVAVGYLGPQIRNELGAGEAYGVKLSYSESQLGTGGALLHLKQKLKRTFLAVNVTHPLNFDLLNLLKFHRQHDPWVTVASRSLKDLCGIYVIEPKLLSLIPEGFCTLEESVFDEAMSFGKLLTYPIPSDQPL